MRRASVAIVWGAAALAVGAACHRRAQPAAAPEPAPREEHCWWTVSRTPAAPDTVAARFAAAFAALGLRGAAWTRAADTAWAHAAPTPLGGEWRGALYEARAVAYRRGDSSSYRVYAALGWPRGAAAAANEGALQIPFCAARARAAGGGGARAPAPAGEEALAVWRRRD